MRSWVVIGTLSATLVWCAGASADRGQLDLISQGNGTTAGEFMWASPDGSRVIFLSNLSLVPSDDDTCGAPFYGCHDLYQRSGGVTTLLTPGGSGTSGVFWTAASAHGSTIYFHTDDGLVAGDTDGQEDAYQRSGGTISLVTTGP